VGVGYRWCERGFDDLLGGCAVWCSCGKGWVKREGGGLDG